jgi:hypothetical protein
VCDFHSVRLGPADCKWNSDLVKSSNTLVMEDNQPGLKFSTTAESGEPIHSIEELKVRIGRVASTNKTLTCGLPLLKFVHQTGERKQKRVKTKSQNPVR